jgi:hypothetical protein
MQEKKRKKTEKKNETKNKKKTEKKKNEKNCPKKKKALATINFLRVLVYYLILLPCNAM